MRPTKAVFNFVVGLISAVLLSSESGAADRFYAIKLTEPSKIWLIGSVGPVEFSCDIGSFITKGIVPWSENSGSSGDVSGRVVLDIVIPVARVDCGNNLMNHDLRRAMRAKEYPQIAFSLLSHALTSSYKDAEKGAPFSIESTGNLTISGVTRVEKILVKGQFRPDSSFQISGTYRIDMVDFGIKPPIGLFGMVKVDRYLTIHFDVIAVLEELPQSPKS